MELRVLKYFLATAREGTITGAANYLHLTQPTLSRQLKDLENELGQELFIRSNHSISLTPEGMLLRKRAEEILDMVAKTERELATTNDTIEGEIYLGCGETDVLKDIADIIVEIRKQYPEIIFHMSSGTLEEVTEKLDKGLLDFGVIMNPSDSLKYNSITLPKKDLWGIVTRKDNPLAQKRELSFDNLEGIPLILSRKVLRNYSQNNEFYNWFNAKKDKLNIAATHTLFYNAATMVQQGVGSVLTLNNLANTNKGSDLCFIPLTPRIESGWDIVWKRYQMFSPAAKLFLEKVQEKFSKDSQLSRT